MTKKNYLPKWLHKKNSSLLLLFAFANFGAAQYSPIKKYKQDPLIYDTVSKLYKTAYLPKAPVNAPNNVR